MNYYTEQRADERPGNGRIARYAWGIDYHQILGDRLTQLAERISALAPDSLQRAYVDTGPVMEKGVGPTGRARLDRQTFQSSLRTIRLMAAVGGNPDDLGIRAR